MNTHPIQLIERKKEEAVSSVQKTAETTNSDASTALYLEKLKYDEQMLQSMVSQADQSSNNAAPATSNNAAPVTTDFPVYPGDGDLPDWFTADVPDDFEGFGYPGSNIMDKLSRMLSYASNSENKNAISILTLFIANLAKKIAGHPELQAKLQKYLEGIKTSDGTTMLKMLVDTLVTQYFYYSGDTSTAFLDQLEQMFTGSDDISQKFRDTIDDWKSKWNSYVHDHSSGGKPDMSYSDYMKYIIRPMWGEFIQNSNINKISHSIMGDEIKDMIAKYGIAGLMYIIQMLFSGADSDTCNQMTGLSSLTKDLGADTKTLGDITQKWGGDWTKKTSQDAVDWIKEIEQLQKDIKTDPQLDSISSNIDATIDKILNEQAVDSSGKGLTDSSGNPVTLKMLADGTYTPQKGQPSDDQLLLTSVQYFKSTATSQGSQDITTDTQSIYTSLSSTSSSVATQQNNAISTDENYMSSESTIQKSWLDGITAIISNFKSA